MRTAPYESPEPGGCDEDGRTEGPLEIAMVGDLTDGEGELTDRMLGVGPGEECTIYFDSPGGSPYCAMSLMSLIKLRRVRATGIVTGECSSATLWPFAACERRIVTPYSVLLFHPMRWQSEENVGLAEAAEWARHFGDLEKQMDELLAQMFGVDAKLMDEWINPGKYVSGREIADAGIAELVEFNDLARLCPTPIAEPALADGPSGLARRVDAPRPDAVTSPRVPPPIWRLREPSKEARPMTTPILAKRAVCCLLLFASVLGCYSDPLEEKVASLVHPTGALGSGDAQLVTLVKQVERESGLPSQLDGPLGPTGDNLAAALAASYSASEHARLAPALDELISPDAALAGRRALLIQNKSTLEQTVHAVGLPRCRWEVAHRHGFFARMRYLDDARLASRLLLVAALSATDSEGGKIAFQHVQRSLRIAHELGRVRRVEARILADRIRNESLSVFEDLAKRAYLDSAAADSLYGQLRDLLADWPNDSRMLVGERALVIHTFEAIRAGLLDQMLLPDERQRLDEQGVLAELRAATPAQINADQIVCLKVINRLMADADRPYFERLSSINEAFTQAEQEPPLFAQRMLLPNLRDALRISAEDRARCEAWTILLASSANLRMPPFQINPVDGSPYVVKPDEQGVSVSLGVGNDQAIRLPRLKR